MYPPNGPFRRRLERDASRIFVTSPIPTSLPHFYCGGGVGALWMARADGGRQNLK
jgi:hypothetical protein